MHQFVDIVDFKTDVEVEVAVLEQCVKLVACLQSLCRKGEALVLQLVERDGGAFGQWMRVAHHHAEGILKEVVRLDALVVLCRFVGKYQVHLASHEHLHQFAHGVAHHVEAHVGMFLHKEENSLFEDGAERIGRADVHRSAYAVRHFGNTIQASISLVHGTEG